MNRHFNDVNYLTGRRMQRNHNHAMTNDREQHLKRTLKSGLKKSRDPQQPRNDANVFSKIMQERQLLQPCTTMSRRVTIEPRLEIFGIPKPEHVPSVSSRSDIFGNQNRRNHLGIFGQSKCGSTYDYKRKRKQKAKTKHTKSFKINPVEENVEYINRLIPSGSYDNAKWIVESSNLFV